MIFYFGLPKFPEKFHKISQVTEDQMWSSLTKKSRLKCEIFSLKRCILGQRLWFGSFQVLMQFWRFCNCISCGGGGGGCHCRLFTAGSWVRFWQSWSRLAIKFSSNGSKLGIIANFSDRLFAKMLWSIWLKLPCERKMLSNSDTWRLE